MESAGGTPGWEAGVSAQTRGPGARQEVQTRERETNGHGREQEKKGLGATDSTLWGVSQLCRVQRFRKRQSYAG